MTSLLKDKYNNVLEMVEETGKIPMMCIDDGEVRPLIEELEELGFICEIDSSTDYLLVEKKEEINEGDKMLKKIKFLGDELGLSYDLEGSYGRKLLHESIDKFYNTFLTTDTDENDNIIRYFLETDITGPQTELRDKLAKNDFEDFIFEYDDIDITEYQAELQQLNKLISNKDIDGLISFDSKFYNRLFIYDKDSFYKLDEIRKLEEALQLVAKHSNTRSATDRAYQEFYRLSDDFEEYGEVDREIYNNVKKEILDAAKYAGYTNIQYELLAEIREVLER